MAATPIAGRQGYVIRMQNEITLYSQAAIYICMCRGPAERQRHRQLGSARFGSMVCRQIRIH